MTTQWAMTTGDNIAAELRRKRRSQADLGELLGLSQAAVSRKLRGKAPMTVDELFTIAEWLDVLVTDLLPAVRGDADHSRHRRSSDRLDRPSPVETSRGAALRTEAPGPSTWNVRSPALTVVAA